MTTTVELYNAIRDALDREEMELEHNQQLKLRFASEIAEHACDDAWEKNK